MERITRVRAGILLTLFCLIVGFFALKLYDMQIIDTDGTVDNTKTFTTYTVVKAARGEILDRNGNKLVSNRASYDLVFNHYVIISASGTNDYLKSLVELCRELDIPYNDHFPVSKAAPFTYTLSEYNATWQGYFQAYLPEKGGLDSDISAPLLMKKLRTLYKIPEEWSEEDARAVIGLRYELDLRQGITNLPNYIFIADASTQALSAILELNSIGATLWPYPLTIGLLFNPFSFTYFSEARTTTAAPSVTCEQSDTASLPPTSAFVSVPRIFACS